jgi:hypothetical protein
MRWVWLGLGALVVGSVAAFALFNRAESTGSDTRVCADFRATLEGLESGNPSHIPSVTEEEFDAVNDPQLRLYTDPIRELVYGQEGGPSFDQIQRLLMDMRVAVERCNQLGR